MRQKNIPAPCPQTTAAPSKVHNRGGQESVYFLDLIKPRAILTHDEKIF